MLSLVVQGIWLKFYGASYGVLGSLGPCDFNECWGPGRPIASDRCRGAGGPSVAAVTVQRRGFSLTLAAGRFRRVAAELHGAFRHPP